MSLFDRDKDYYAILGADENSTQRDIERLYKQRAMRFHPDRGGDEEGMKLLNEAYAVLRDASARSAYDTARSNDQPRATGVTPINAPPAHVDLPTAQWLGAILFMVSGLVLLLLVRFQWIWFIWPLAVLAFFLVATGVLLAHASVRRIASRYTLSRKWLAVSRELAFWTVVASAGYGLYLVIR